MRTEKEIIKELVDSDIRCFKIIDKDGNEVDSLYMDDDYNYFIKHENNKHRKDYFDIFVELFKK